MSGSKRLEFVLKGKRDGVEITPSTISFNRFNEFNQQVAEFLAGSKGIPLDEMHPSVEEGSYKLAVFLPALLLAAVEPDIQALQRQDSLGEIDSKRAEVVKKWQSQARKSSDNSVEIRPVDIPELASVKLTHETDYRIGDVSPWVQVEKYLVGTVEDMGGATRANLHLRIPGIKDQVTIAADQSYLKNQDINRLYHRVLVRVSAQQHHKTGTLRNLRLISFEDHAPAYDEAALERFTEAGRLAWADVPDAAAWVREQRGGD
jgi:hypothetical protein